jgi:hypothetical protein
MASELPFEYHFRYNDFIRMLTSNEPSQIAKATQLLEDRDRELEDYLKNIHSGGTAQSLISVTKDSGTFTALHDGDGVDVVSLAITIPEITGLTYWLDATATIVYRIDDDHSGDTRQVNVFAYLRDESGLYLNDGWLSNNSYVTSYTGVGSGYGNSGIARELSNVPAGETRHIKLNVSNNKNSAALQPQWNVSGAASLHIKLFSIPS